MRQVEISVGAYHEVGMMLVEQSFPHPFGHAAEYADDKMSVFTS